MPKAAAVVFADTDRPEGLGRIVNAMTTVKEFNEAGDGATLIFDGAGTKWIGELSGEDHKYNELYRAWSGETAADVRVAGPGRPQPPLRPRPTGVARNRAPAQSLASRTPGITVTPAPPVRVEANRASADVDYPPM